MAEISQGLECNRVSRVLELVQRAKDGDEQAFGELYGLYSKNIYRFVYARTRNHYDTEDIVSQTFLKAWQNMARFRVPGTAIEFEAWLLRIARNVAVDGFRAPREQRLADLAQPSLAVRTPEGAIEHSERLHDLERAMAQLSPAQRQVVVLRYIVGLDLHSIAEATGRKVGAVRVIQHRAQENLRRLVPN